MPEFTVAVAQTNPALGDIAANLSQMTAAIDQICREQHPDLIVFPELATTGVENGMSFNVMAERLPGGHQLNILARKAADFSVHIVFGMPTRAKVETSIYNAAVLVGPDGELIGNYRKIHLLGEEKLSFRPGYRFSMFDTALGVIGVMIGSDLAFPEAARALTLLGAEIICLPAAYETGLRGEWQAFTMARAAENGVFLLAANRVGEEPSRSFLGDSVIVAPNGRLLARLESGGEDGVTTGYAFARIDTNEVRRTRETRQFIMARTPTAYSPIVKKY
jgi:predicted amidohydrolase